MLLTRRITPILLTLTYTSSTTHITGQIVLVGRVSRRGHRHQLPRAVRAHATVLHLRVTSAHPPERVAIS